MGFWDFWVLPMSCKHFLLHLLGMVLGMGILLLIIWGAFEYEHKGKKKIIEDIQEIPFPHNRSKRAIIPHSAREHCNSQGMCIYPHNTYGEANTQVTLTCYSKNPATTCLIKWQFLPAKNKRAFQFVRGISHPKENGCLLQIRIKITENSIGWYQCTQYQKGLPNKMIETEVTSRASIKFPPVSEWFLALLSYQQEMGGGLYSHLHKREIKEDICTACLQKTKQGTRISMTLIYYTMKPECNETIIPPCTYNNTQYNQCYTPNGIQCYEPKALGPTESTVTIVGYQRGGSSDRAAEYKKGENFLIGTNTTKGTMIDICFDVCTAIGKGQGGVKCGSRSWEQQYIVNHRYLWQSSSTGSIYGGYEGTTYWYAPLNHQTATGPAGIALSQPSVATDCSSGSCTPLCLHLNLTKINYHYTHHNPAPTTKYLTLGIGIDGTGKDPYGLIAIKTELTKLTNQPVKFFWSYEQEIAKLNDLPTPPSAKNMFINLAQEVAKELMLKNCFVCGGTTMGDRWPWHVQEANYTEIALWQGNFTFNNNFNETWQVTSHIIGQICYTRNKNNRVTRNKPMGFLKCSNEWENNTWVSQINMTQPENSLLKITKLKGLSDPENDAIVWNSPDGLYWICGNFAYNMLPAGWYGSCILGAIQPSFFLIPMEKKQKLGVPVYDTLGRRKRSVYLSKGVKIGNWKDDEWPPERIIAYYDPATWAQDGSWGYRTPIYMINRIIRLQAVLEIITNETALALTKLAKESVLSRTYIMQNRLALDYLLAAEGGVCGKFNLSNCCIQIDDSGTVIEKITRKMIQTAHVPVQTWKGILDTDGWLGGIFNNWKQGIFFIGITILGLIMLPCILPLLRSTIQSIVEATVQKQALLVAANTSEVIIPGYPMNGEFRRKKPPMAFDLSFKK